MHPSQGYRLLPVAAIADRWPIARLHVAAGMADVLRAAEIEPAAVGVDAVEADAVEIAAADG